MLDHFQTNEPNVKDAARERHLDMQHLQGLEGNPLTPDDPAMSAVIENALIPQ